MVYILDPIRYSQKGALCMHGFKVWDIIGLPVEGSMVDKVMTASRLR